MIDGMHVTVPATMNAIRVRSRESVKFSG